VAILRRLGQVQHEASAMLATSHVSMHKTPDCEDSVLVAVALLLGQVWHCMPAKFAANYQRARGALEHTMRGAVAAAAEEAQCLWPWPFFLGR
jgi:hypothetical protein